jgi:hypothetical protein
MLHKSHIMVKSYKIEEFDHDMKIQFLTDIDFFKKENEQFRIGGELTIIQIKLNGLNFRYGCICSSEHKTINLYCIE